MVKRFQRVVTRPEGQRRINCASGFGGRLGGFRNSTNSFQIPLALCARNGLRPRIQPSLSSLQSEISVVLNRFMFYPKQSLEREANRRTLSASISILLIPGILLKLQVLVTHINRLCNSL